MKIIIESIIIYQQTRKGVGFLILFLCCYSTVDCLHSYLCPVQSVSSVFKKYLHTKMK